MKIKALYTLLSKKFKDGEVIFIDKLDIAKPKTSDAVAILQSMSSIKACSDILSKRKNSALIETSTKNFAVEKSFANIGNVTVDELAKHQSGGLGQYEIFGH